jgi:hypothetical protein
MKLWWINDHENLCHISAFVSTGPYVIIQSPSNPDIPSLQSVCALSFAVCVVIQLVFNQCVSMPAMVVWGALSDICSVASKITLCSFAFAIFAHRGFSLATIKLVAWPGCCLWMYWLVDWFVSFKENCARMYQSERILPLFGMKEWMYFTKVRKHEMTRR